MARPRLPLDETQVVGAYQAGRTLPAIARDLGVDRSRVTRAVTDLGLFRDQRGTHTAADRAPAGHHSGPELVARAGITYRQFDYWTRTGLLTPAERPAGATSGTPRYYPTGQIHRAATVAWLLDAGISLQTIRAVLDDLLATGQTRLPNGMTIHLPDQP